MNDGQTDRLNGRPSGGRTDAGTDRAATIIYISRKLVMLSFTLYCILIGCIMNKFLFNTFMPDFFFLRKFK